MDKFEVIGYSTAAGCLVATLAVFFLWIMPAHSAIAKNRGDISVQANKLKDLKNKNEIALTDAKVDDIDAMLKLTQDFLVTDIVQDAAKKARVTFSGRTKELINRIIKAHEVEKPKAEGDLSRPAKLIREDLGKAFKDAGVEFVGTTNYSLSGDSATNVDPFTFRTFQVFQQVTTNLFKTSTPITLIRPTVDPGSNNLNSKQDQVSEKVTAISSFVYFDSAKWANRLKLYRDENAKAARQPSNQGEPKADELLTYERTGFRIVFQTNPINVAAALNALEEFDGKYLVMVKRLEVIRAGLPIYSLADYEKTKAEIPLPYRDGNVQVTAEVEMIRFEPGTADKMMAKLYKDGGN